ncbi:putative ubiquitin fusion degradation protein Ufd1 [Septoria linicola]|nr:putative ubiquitin fusion degradation protein Ufd1 [Septoria linicola]
MTESPQSSLKWTAQYTVSAPGHWQKMSGDKILLPPSALEQLLSASSNAAAENARRDLPQYDPYNSSTYSAYRQAESQYQDQRQQLPHPLTFRLVNPVNGRVVYAGVREFSAEEGEAVLSPFLLETLGINAADAERQEDVMEVDSAGEAVTSGHKRPSITVHARQLPKGTFVKLRPLEPGYDPEDWKALLEQHLRANYTTMTNGEVLMVPGGRGVGGKREEFRFLVDGLKPDVDGICVVDTDLEVDIEALNEEQARETMKRVAAKMTKQPGTEHGSSPGGELDLFKEQHGQILPGDYVDYTLPSWNRTLALEIELDAEDEEEDVNLLVSPFSTTQRAKPRIDEHVFADLDTRPSKRTRLEPTNAELEHAEALQVTIWAFAPDSSDNATVSSPVPRHFTLRVRHADTSNGVIDLTADAADGPPNEGDVRCKNCKQWVPQGRMMLHENFCLRNNLLCPRGCGQVFQKRSPEFEKHWHCPHDSSFGNTPSSRLQHEKIVHPSEVLRCSDCSTAETFHNLPALAHHRTTTCPGKPILCRFCHLEVPQEGDPDVPNAEALLSGMTVHELADGARTTECHLCQKIVRLRDMEIHLKNHDLDRHNRQTPIPCRNINCGRTLDTCSKTGDTRAGTRMGQGPGNDVGLCSVCFGPLYVSLHDPDNKALRRRVERRYLQQLLTGCGRSWCKNEFCKIGRKNTDLSTNITTKDALPMIKPFLTGLTESGQSTPLHFCVDEGSQKRRNLATMLAAEDGGPAGKGGFSFEWCVGALEAEGGDLDAARVWLKNWAPARAEERR